MLLTITLAISGLVLINFLLLLFSTKILIKAKKEDKKPVLKNREVPVKSISTRLAPTGS